MRRLHLAGRCRTRRPAVTAGGGGPDERVAAAPPATGRGRGPERRAAERVCHRFPWGAAVSHSPPLSAPPSSAGENGRSAAGAARRAGGYDLLLAGPRSSRWDHLHGGPR